MSPAILTKSEVKALRYAALEHSTKVLAQYREELRLEALANCATLGLK